MQLSLAPRSVFRRAPDKTRRAAPQRRRLMFDHLEDRRLLSAGDLDPTFGNSSPPNGVSAFQLGTNSGNAAEAISLLPNNDIVTVGGTIPLYSQYQANFLVDRLLPNGSLDGTFGSKGMVQTSFGKYDWATATAVAVQSNGDTVAAGNTSVSYWTNHNYAFALARYNTTGALDTTFGQKGKVITELAPGSEDANAVAIYPANDPNGNAGKIVVVGDANANLAVLRYTAAGKLDTGFNGNGVSLTSLGTGNPAYATAEVIQPDGKVVVLGYINGKGTLAGDVVLMRFNANGSLDTSFGAAGTGIETANFGGASLLNTAALEPDGSIVAAGAVDGSAGLVHFLSDGAVDASFGGAGTGAAIIPNTQQDTNSGTPYGIEGVSVDASGNITFAGSVRTNNTPGFDYLAGRVDSSGILDPSYGGSGYVINPIDWYGLYGAAFYPAGDTINGQSVGGDILASGYDRSGTHGYERALVGRFLGDPPAPPASAILASPAPSASPAVASSPSGSAAAATAAVFAAYAYPEDDELLS